MKIVRLLPLFFFLGCTHLETYSGSDWVGGDDRVAYVRFNQDRMPATVPPGKYRIIGTCGGWPKVDLKTPPGFCAGLVYDAAGAFRKLRWAAPVSQTRALVTEMGGWANFNGKILQLDFSNGRSSIKPIITPSSFPAGDPRRGIINEPNQISRGPDGKFYVGGATGLYRFNPEAAIPASTVEAVITGIPGLGLHPLKSFTFDNKGNVFINVGAASNVCQNFTKYGDPDPAKNPKNPGQKQWSLCPEVEDIKVGQAQIRRYQMLADRTFSKDFTIYAKGLRNSVALTWDPVHEVLIEGDNGRDAINKFAPNLVNADLPHEKINILGEGKHYGWPYCYDGGKNNPEWFNIDCTPFEKPYLLLPAHAAPLGFIVYQGTMFPEMYKGRLIAALHGYEPKGHRLVTFNQDVKGLPTGTAFSLIYDWEKRGAQEKGKPVGVSELPDGSLLIVEDEPQNKILRLFYDPKLGDGKPVQEIDQVVDQPNNGKTDEEVLKARLEDKLRSGNVPPFTMFEAKVIDKTCYECHQADGAPGVRLIRYDDEGNEKRVRAAGKAKDLLTAIRGLGPVPAMPPQGWDSSAEQATAIKLIEQWLKTF